MKLATAIITLLLPLPLLAAEPGPHMPPQFIGHWAGSPQACRALADDQILRIEASQISWWESTGQLRAVVANGDSEVALIAEMSGEGDTWLSTALLRLEEDGRLLIDETAGPDRALVRHRCPAR